MALTPQQRSQAEGYLLRSGWKKEPGGWWRSPFGYGIKEAIKLHAEAAEGTARAFEAGEYRHLIPGWLEMERKA